jgi:integrase
MKTRAEVLEMVRSKVRLRHYSLCTEDAYTFWTGRYYDFCRIRSREESSEAKAEAYLTDLAKRSYSAKSQNQAFSALLFLYKDVLGKPLGDVNAMRAKRPIHERVAPSREQIIRFRAAATDRPHTPTRLLVDLIYGCGLRVSEPLELRVQDVLWGENQLLLRSAKGGKDRRVPIPNGCIEPLRLQIDQAREVWEWDRKNQPAVGVPLPVRLGYKYPVAPYSWQWFWIFPAPGHCRDPLTDQIVRFHLLHDALQRAVHEASVAAGLDHLITPHVLRHAYATHSREPIETLKELMGHWSIETTAGYRHSTVTRASNPLDDLLAASPTTPPAAVSAPTIHPVHPPPNPVPSSMPAVLHREDLVTSRRLRWKERPLWVQHRPVIV